MMTTISCTIDSKDDIFLFSNSFYIKTKLLITSLKALRSVNVEVTFEAAEIDTKRFLESKFNN